MILVGLADTQIVFVNDIAILPLFFVRQTQIRRFDFGVVEIETFDIHAFCHK